MDLKASKAVQLFQRPTLDSRIFRHLLRALLREASYLPDPAARTYHHDRILSTFRSYRTTYQSPKELFASESDQVNRAATERAAKRQSPWQANLKLLRPNVRSSDRQAQLFHQGKTELSRLARANLGHDGPLMRILNQTYGRSGKRKWQLLQPLLEPEELAKTSDLQQALDKSKKTTSPTFVIPDRLMALVKAQSTASLPAPLTKLKVDPGLYKLTERLRPMPLKTKRNTYNRWMKEIKERILVPLPSEECERLEDIASGRNMHGVGARERRPMGSSKAQKPMRIISKPLQEEDHTPDSAAVRIMSAEIYPSIVWTDDSHNLTRRYLSRCLKKVYEQVPSLQLIEGRWRANFPDNKDLDWKEYLPHDETKLGRSSKRQSGKTIFTDHWMFSDDPAPPRQPDEAAAQMVNH